MNADTVFLATLSLFGWGVGAFFSKPATNRMGEGIVFWNIIVYVPIIMSFSLSAFKEKDILSGDIISVIYGPLAGGIGATGLIAFLPAYYIKRCRSRHFYYRNVPSANSHTFVFFRRTNNSNTSCSYRISFSIPLSPGTIKGSLLMYNSLI